jgi:phage anti-repressor protein
MNELIKVEKVAVGNKEINSVSARELYVGLGLDKSQWARWNRENILNNDFFAEGIDFAQLDIMPSANQPNPPKDFAISIDFAKHIAMQARTDKSHQYRNYMVECERRLYVPKTALELAREQVLLLEALEETKIQLDAAITTKAEIGHRREATAMNTASQAVKKASKLEKELDKSKDYATIKRMEMVYHGQKFSWRLLKSACTEMEIEADDIFDQNYGTVKAYPAAAWMEAYAIDINGI